MINLLPSFKKQEIKQEENWKILMTLSIGIFAILICFVLILYAINIFISGDVELERILYKQKEKEFESSEMQALKTKIVEFNKSVLQLDGFYQNQLKPTETINKISNTVPSGIYLTNLSLDLGDENDPRMKCELKGFSQIRETLLGFKEKLENEEDFEEVSFPPSTWLKSTDIIFTVTFKIK